MDKLFNSLPLAKQQLLLEGPAIPPPPGVVPNFANPPNSRHIGWIVTTLGAVLSTLSVCARIYSRAVIAKKVMLEDFIVVAALAVFGAFEYYVFRIVNYPGYYVHTWDMPLKELSGFLYNMYSGATVHGAVIMLLKAAILLDLLRIFSARGQRGYFFWIAHTLIWSNIVFYTTCTFLEIFACQPREKLWNKLLPGGHCINSNALTLASSIINVPSDLVIFILPQRAIWKLNRSRRRRLGVSLIFAVAIFACVSAIIRLAYSVVVLHHKDILYNSAPVGVWIQAEITAGFMIVGIPALPKIFKHSVLIQKCATRFKTWTGSSGSKDGPDPQKRFPSWYRPASRKGPRRERGWSDLELTESDTKTAHSQDDVKSQNSQVWKVSQQEIISSAPEARLRE